MRMRTLALKRGGYRYGYTPCAIQKNVNRAGCVLISSNRESPPAFRARRRRNVPRRVVHSTSAPVSRSCLGASPRFVVRCFREKDEARREGERETRVVERKPREPQKS